MRQLSHVDILLVVVLTACRYYLLFQNKGLGERAVATQQWTTGLATEEAMAVEGHCCLQCHQMRSC